MRQGWCPLLGTVESKTNRVVGKGVFLNCRNARLLLVHRNPTSLLRMSYKSITTGFQLVDGGAIPSIRFHNYIMMAKQTTKHISYASYENKILVMEDELMEHFACNRSDLHKMLVREKYLAITLLK